MRKKSARAPRRHTVPVQLRTGGAATPSASRAPWLIGTLLASAALHSAMPLPVHASGRPSAVAVDAPAQQHLEHTFAIAPGRLADVLADFTSTTGIVFSFGLEDLGTVQSADVSGRFSAEQALEIILAGTGTAARFTTESSATLELAVQSVDVVARSTTVSSPSDALRNVPGITMQAGEGGGAPNTSGDMFNLRGFNAAKSLFVDGVRDDGLISRDTFNLEQVEVFMGPTGTDVGRGTAAGYVNMQTRVPATGVYHNLLRRWAEA